MKNIELKLAFTEYELEELSAEEKNLYDKAMEAAKMAYAPYSGFSVGAACLLDNGEVFTANNQENAAYPSGLCAERSLLFYVGANRPDQTILKLVVVIKSKLKDGKKVYSPCGACRQVMAEYQNRQSHPIQLMFESGENRVLACNQVDDLLPFIFKF
jgi:cytidine deaminase